MRVTREKPEILRFIYRQEQDDPHYGSCLWAIFDLDPGRGLFNVQSDCGNYAYRWPERGNMFLKLFLNMTESYLLGKLCGKPEEFDEKGTIESIDEYLSEMEISEQKKKRALESLKSTWGDYSLDDAPELAQFLVDEWNNDNNLEIDCAWELVNTVYSAHQKRTVQIFREHIVPQIRQALEDGFYRGSVD